MKLIIDFIIEDLLLLLFAFALEFEFDKGKPFSFEEMEMNKEKGNSQIAKPKKEAISEKFG